MAFSVMRQAAFMLQACSGAGLCRPTSQWRYYWYSSYYYYYSWYGYRWSSHFGGHSSRRTWFRHSFHQQLRASSGSHCLCFVGYAGQYCERCAPGFQRDRLTQLCLPAPGRLQCARPARLQTSNVFAEGESHYAGSYSSSGWYADYDDYGDLYSPGGYGGDGTHTNSSGRDVGSSGTNTVSANSPGSVLLSAPGMQPPYNAAAGPAAAPEQVPGGVIGLLEASSGFSAPCSNTTFSWVWTQWSECSQACNGVQRRDVKCQRCAAAGLVKCSELAATMLYKAVV